MINDFGVADFADWTWEEFRSHRLGAAQNCSATLKGNHRITDVVLPAEVCQQQLST
jgi:cathepsin H